MKPVALVCLASMISSADTAHLLLQRPTVNKSHIVFSFADDLWSVPRAGGNAVRLTSGNGVETSPYFSPDGTQVAFSGQYEGNLDVYVVPAEGGVPKRLTWHPAEDHAVGWTNDGKRVLFRAARGRNPQLHTVSKDGGPSEALPLHRAAYGSYSNDGSHLAYMPVGFRRGLHSYDSWKQYRGGTATQIWIAKLADSSITKVPWNGSNDSHPIFIGDKVFFLSDKNGLTTLFEYDTRSKKVQRAGAGSCDIKWATAGPDVIAYECFGEIRLYNPNTKKDVAVPIQVSADLPGVRPRFSGIAKHIRFSNISPSGARAVFEARGEIVTVPGGKGDARNLTNTTGVHERMPSWSPDGKQIAYWSDASGEYNLHIRSQNGMDEPRVIVMQEQGFYFEPHWSPDSRRLAFADNKLQLWTLDVESGKQTKIDADTYYDPLGLQRIDPAWSPDSRWISYTKKLKNHLRAVFVHSVETGKSHQVTDGMSDAQSAMFDRDGKYLYFTASTDLALTPYWLDMTSQMQQPTRNVYLAVLRNDVPSPIAPESDEEKAASDGSPAPPKVLAFQQEPKADAPAEMPKTTESEVSSKPKKTPEATRIDLEDLGQRIIALPIPARNYEGLVAGKNGVLYLAETMTPGAGVSGSTIHMFTLNTRKVEKLLDNVTAFSVSADGEKMLFAKAQKWTIAGANAAPKPDVAAMNIDAVQVRVDPKAEWKQMYTEAWRIERDWFYDPNHHGVNLLAASKKYQPWLEQVSSRTDLNYLFQEMLGDLTVGHLYIRGGDVPEVTSTKTGLLGADFTVENNRYRFSHVYSGENWNPSTRAPLTQPGVNVKAGEYLLTVNGRNVTPDLDVYAYFEGTADRQIMLKVGSDPNGANARQVTVVPVDSEVQLRNLAWVEGNRRKVDQLSNGRIAYVYLPNTGQAGYANFNRYYFSQVGKEGAVIDERNNGGGQAADYVVNFLNRPLLNYWTTRYGETFTTPRGAIFGPKAMIINELAGSGGDALPWYFRRMKLGPLVGKRTWGGLVGILGFPTLMDGGAITAPNLAFFSPEGEWEVENRGVAPDVDVEDDPQLVRQGRDPQLEKAIDLVLAQLPKTAPKQPKKPAYPNYHRKSSGNATVSEGQFE